MANDQDEEVACPVCGKSVGMDVSSCPYCGAEFEEAEVEESVHEVPAKAAPATPAAAPQSDEEEDVACPVCGVMVGIDVSCCPKCGAEFEEEEIEEVIEVEERTVFEAEPEPAPARARSAQKPKAAAKPSEKPKAKPKARPKEEPALAADLPHSIMDFRVIGVSLIILGLIGTQIALMLDWYYSWVPPIEDNLALFVVIPVAILVVGLLVFMLIKRASSSGKKVPGGAPGMSLSLFLFGIFALIVIVLWDPINTAMQESQATVGGAFAIALVLGILLVFVGMRRASAEAA